MGASLYIHQNPKSDNSSYLNRLNQQLTDKTLIKAQRKIIKRKRADLKKTFEDSKMTLEKIWSEMQEANKDVTEQLQSIDFRGTTKKGTKNTPGTLAVSKEEIQTKLDEASTILDSYIDIINAFSKKDETRENKLFSEKDINNLIKEIKTTQEAIEELNKGEAVKDWHKAIGLIVSHASNIIGVLVEYHTAALLQDYLDKLDKNVGKNVKVKLTGAQHGKTYNKITSDLKVIFDTGVEEKDIGVSIKRTSAVSKDSVLTKVKTAKLESLLTASYARIDRNGLYNVIANHGRTYYKFSKPGERRKSIPTDTWSYGNFGSLVQMLHKIFALTALSGELGNNDFASYIIINDEIYSILELVEDYLLSKEGEENRLQYISSNFTSKQEKIRERHFALVTKSLGEKDWKAAGDARSNEMIKQINSMSIVIKARIRLSADLLSKT